MAGAACIGQPTDLFFPSRAVNASTMANARAICSMCEVQPECLDDASANAEVVGVWGGTSMLIVG
jgi:WhiB family redox-sensing transcriptional regulator